MITDFERLVRALTEGGVAFVGVALVSRGGARVTGDLKRQS